MGIYPSDSIFGIKIYQFDGNSVNVLFEAKYDTIMSDEVMRDVYLFYIELKNKHEVHFAYYTECSTTYGEGTFFSWFPMSLNIFLEKFGI
jgi:hypothetical protein